MNIPESIRIGGVEYAIVREPFLSDNTGHELMGQIRYRQCMIALSKNVGMCHDVACMTLWHEILHGLARHFDLKLEEEEAIVDAFARGVYQVLQDNANRLFDLKEEYDVEKNMPRYIDGTVIHAGMHTEALEC